MTNNRYLVAGALGVVGRGFIDHCRRNGLGQTIGLSRREAASKEGTEMRAIDLLDADDVKRAIADVGGVTHVVFAAYLPRPTLADEVAPNLEMLRNLMEALKDAPSLRHVTLLQGVKAYGGHLGPFKTPALETDARHMPPNFYYDQEDYLVDLQRSQPWKWTILRPTTIYGFSTQSPMNLITVMGVYAAISRELGLPLRFPGSEKAYSVLRQAVSSQLVAEAIAWGGLSPAAGNQIFNITNGDHFRWPAIWAILAELFDMPLMGPQKINLTVFMQDKAALWGAMVKKYGLEPHPYRDLVHWPFGDLSFNIEYDNVLSTTKLRQAGFPGFMDSYDMYKEQIGLLRAGRIIP